MTDRKATIVTEFPHVVREIEHAWIPLADGMRLATRYWLPESADTEPVPAILEYIPYCKRDGTAARDEAVHPYFAGHGYAAIRVDMRGSGESTACCSMSISIKSRTTRSRLSPGLRPNPGVMGMSA